MAILPLLIINADGAACAGTGGPGRAAVAGAFEARGLEAWGLEARGRDAGAFVAGRGVRTGELPGGKAVADPGAGAGAGTAASTGAPRGGRLSIEAICAGLMGASAR